MERAKALSAKTERERDYVTAIEAFYKDSESDPGSQRTELNVARLYLQEVAQK